MRIRNLFDPGLGSGIQDGKIRFQDLGSGMEKFGSGINIPDPQHCVERKIVGVVDPDP
jgi:hypothetical protein